MYTLGKQVSGWVNLDSLSYCGVSEDQMHALAGVNGSFTTPSRAS